MGRWVALLRGINVGGGNRLPMAELRACAGGLGWQDVATYIASGNMVFRAEGEAEALAADLRGALPLDVAVTVLSARNFVEISGGCPFVPEAGNLVHGMVFRDRPVLDAALAADLKTDEDWAIAGRCLWLHTPSGFSRSKVAEKIGRLTGGAEMTARNLNTFRKLAEMLDGMGAD